MKHSQLLSGFSSPNALVIGSTWHLVANLRPLAVNSPHCSQLDILCVIRKHGEPEKKSRNADLDPDTTLIEMSVPLPQKSRVAQQEGEKSRTLSYYRWRGKG